MPYSGPNDPDLPEHVQKLPEKKRRQWIAVFEQVLEDTGDEGRAMAAANAAVKAAGDSMVLQSVVVSKNVADTLAEAKKIVRDLDFRTGDVDETENSWRFRQRDPDDFDPDSFRTKEIKKGVTLVLGILKRSSAGVKALDDSGRIGGHLVVWGDEAHKDLQDEYFTPDTDLALSWYPRRPVLYQHGLDGTIQIKMIGQIERMTPDDVGVWVEAQLDMRDRYVQAVWKLVQQGQLGWSSGSLPHMVQVEHSGKIVRWPIVEGSLTPTPAEPRHTDAISQKHFCDAQAVTQACKSSGLDLPDLLTPDDASEGATVKEQADDGNSEAAQPLNQPLFSPMEGKLMPEQPDVLTKEEAAQLVADMLKAAREAEEAERKQQTLEAKAARVDQLEQENAELKAKAAPAGEPAKRLPGRASDADDGEERADPSAHQSQPLITVGSKYDHLKAQDMAWGLSYLRALEKATGKAVVSELYVRAMAEKTWGAGYRFLADDGHALKADELIHTANTGFGADWIPEVWNADVWRKARAENVIFNLFPIVEMPTGTVKVRVEGTDPTVYYVPETQDESQLNLDTSASPIPDSRVGSGYVTLEAKKLALRIGISMEETEDAMVPVLPLYREQGMRAMADALDHVILNGDTETAATGNINSDDAQPTSTAKYLVFDGLRKVGLVANPENKLDANGAPTRSLFNQTRFLMPMRHALRTADLAWIVDGSTYSKMLLLPELSTVDKYGSNATVLSGEIGRLDNIPVLPSAEFGLTEADGKISFASPANNTKGQAVCVYRRGWLVGFVRRVTANLAYIPYYDAYQMVATMRVALVRFDNEVASTLYNLG
jgi:HK97 family phage major capsid protein